MGTGGKCRHRSWGWMPLCGLLVLGVLGWAAPAAAEPELIAVLELQPVEASGPEASALTDRLREELLRSQRFVLVDRSQMDAVLNEQALQQTGCTEQECAVQVGRVLGVRKLVAGKVTKITNTIWLVSGIMVDVETAETLRAESVRHQGDFFSLMDQAIVQLAHKLAEQPANGEASAAAATPVRTAVASARATAPAPPPAAPTGTISVLNVPTDAAVLLNGTERGHGPQRFDGLVPGPYEVIVRRPGNREWKRRELLDEGEAVDMDVRLERLRVSLFQVKRSGRWSQSVAETRGWVDWAIQVAVEQTGLQILRNPGEEAWGFFGGVDEEKAVERGRVLDADAVLLFSIRTDTSTDGVWTAYLVDAVTGKVHEDTGRWPYGSEAGPTVTAGVKPLLEAFSAAPAR